MSFALITLALIPAGSLVSDTLGNMNRYNAHLTISNNQIIFTNLDDLTNPDRVYYRDIDKPLVGSQFSDKENLKKPIITHYKIYEDTFKVSISNDTLTEKENFEKDLSPLIEDKDLSETIKRNYVAGKIKFKNNLITQDEYLELLVMTFFENSETKYQDKKLWIRCHEPNNLINGDIVKIYNTEEDFLKDESIQCSPEG